jgi:hypothetical protein
MDIKLDLFIYQKETGSLGELEVDVKIILIWILNKWRVKVMTGFIWLRVKLQALVNTIMNIWVP